MIAGRSELKLREPRKRCGGNEVFRVCLPVASFDPRYQSRDLVRIVLGQAALTHRSEPSCIGPGTMRSRYAVILYQRGSNQLQLVSYSAATVLKERKETYQREQHSAPCASVGDLIRIVLSQAALAHRSGSSCTDPSFWVKLLRPRDDAESICSYSIPKAFSNYFHLVSYSAATCSESQNIRTIGRSIRPSAPVSEISSASF